MTSQAEELIEALNSKPEMIRASYDPDWNNGQIHLEGEMDFQAETPIKEVYELLHKRAMEIGGLVSSNKDKTKVKVSKQFGNCVFILEAEEPIQPVQKITSIDKAEEKERTDTIEELKAMGEDSKEIMEFVEEQIEKGNMSFEIEKSNERQNIMEM